MQKKLIALAIAGLASTAAFAQTNVTIYGVVDAGYVNSSGDSGAGNYNFNGIHSGILAGSRIGFKGEEALGNGLKAVFTLEYGLQVDSDGGIGTGKGSLGTRQSFIGLSNANWGTVALGRQYAPGFAATGRNDALLSSVPSALNQANNAGYSSIVGGSGARISNSVTYTSPNWSGFTVSGIYGFGNEADYGRNADGESANDNDMFGLGLNYANGPLNLDLVYHTRMDQSLTTLGGNPAGSAGPAGLSGEGKNVNEWFIGGSYDFKVVKIMATYQDMDDKNSLKSNIGRRYDNDNQIFSLGAIIPVFGNGKVHVSYANIDWDHGVGRFGTDHGSGDSDIWTVAYTHALSKRTTLYTGYTYTDNDHGVGNAAGALPGVTAQMGENNSTFVAGINHSF